MPKYMTQTDFVDGYVKTAVDEYQKKEKVSLRYVKADKDESLTVSVDGISISILGKDIRKIMGM